MGNTMNIPYIMVAGEVHNSASSTAEHTVLMVQVENETGLQGAGALRRRGRRLCRRCAHRTANLPESQYH